MTALAKILKFLPYIHKTIWFNFHYLPFRQAIRLPVFLYKPKLVKSKGQVEIKGRIKTGMIQLGVYIASIYPDRGITFDNSGKIIFNGTYIIGNDSYISVGDTGVLTIGDNFRASANLRAVCYNRINFGKNILIGWSNIFTDTDFHSVKTGEEDNCIKSRGYAPINIGNDVWFAMNSIILKGTQLPPYCIVGAGSLLSKDYTEYPEHCLFAGNPARMVKENVWRDANDDTINYK